jgi:hypothetical protein
VVNIKQPNKLTIMSNTKHTPGPWQLSKSGEVVYAGVLSVATTHGHHNPKANAKLIAAAPDLLEALQWLMDYPEKDLQQWASDSQPVVMTFTAVHIAKARAAIKKATE